MNRIKASRNSAARILLNQTGIIFWYAGLFFCLFFGTALNIEAQNDPSSEKELIELAEELFDAKRFGEAMERYSQLLSLHPTSSEYNYRYGACLVYAEADKEKAFKHLRFAIGKNDTPVDVHYFLGKAYHLNYQFADALEEYELYKQRSVDQRKPKWDVELAIQQCRNGLKLLSNIKDITVLSKVETSGDEFFRNYDLSDIGGRILVCPEELLSKEDLKSGERFIMYFDGKSSNAFYSSYGKDGVNGRDIYRAVRLPNGNWSKPIPMNRINTPFNDDFPFLHPDGETFYFSSEGHSSMGGYDVFKSTYSESDDSFTQPQNLDFAVNSPDDDMLYITDKDHRLAYFASSRSSDHGRMHVYRVEVSANPLELVLLKGNFIPEAPGVSKSARITVSDATTNELVGEYVTDPKNGNYVIDLPHSGRYKFTVDADGSKLAHNGIVEVPSNDEVVAYAQEIKLIESNNIEKLIIKNSFDTPLTTDLYALAQGILKYRAGLDVNYDEAAGDKPPVTAGNKEKSAYVDAGFAASLSNEQVLEQAREVEQQLTEKSTDIRKQMNYAFTLAQQKRQNAAKASRDAEDYLRLADAVGEEDVSRKYLMKSMASRFAAEKLSEESRVALRLSEQLNDRLAQVEQEEQKAQLMAEDVQNAIQSGSYEQMVESMTALKEYEVAQSTDPVYRADEYLLLRAQAQEKRKMADAESRMAQDLREQENSLVLRIKNRKLQLEAAKNKDKPDIQNEIDVLEDDLSAVQQEIEDLFTGMETSQREAEWMAQQAELYQKINDDQTDTYIPEEQLIPFEAGQVADMKEQITGVETETAGMEFNLNVVRDILEEESNVAMDAFENDAQYQEFIKRYDLPKRAESDQESAAAPEKSTEEIEQEITAARDWIDIIDESVEELQAKRTQVPEGPQRDSIDQKLSEFQELKYQKVQEIDRAEEALSVMEDEATAPYTIAANDQEAIQPQNDSGAADDRLTQTGIQNDPIIAEIDPQYEQRLQELATEDLNNEASIRQRNELDRKFISKLDDAIEPLAAKGEDQLTEKEVNRLARMEILRDKMADELAFSENQLAEMVGTDRPKTSTEILMEASGLALESDETENTSETANQEKDAIPESIGYDDIDPNYEAAMARVEQSSGNERDKLSLQNDLHAALIDQIDEKIDDYESLSQTADGDDQLKIERAISQLQQVKMLKKAEIAENKNEMEFLRRTAFAREYEVVVEEVDTGYVNKYWAIESSNETPYIRAVEKAKLEQMVADGIDIRIEELVVEMDNATTVDEKDEIQETIQRLQTVRQEKVIAYESLFAQAEQLQSVEEDEGVEGTADLADAEGSDRNAGISNENRIEKGDVDQSLAGESGDAVNPETAQSSDSDPETTSEMTAEDLETEVDQFVRTEPNVISNLDQYTVFGEVDDMVYNSLNASVEMESIGGDLKAHQSRISDFVRKNAEGSLDESDRTELNELFLAEMELQDRIANANQTELEYYRSGNENLIGQLETAMPGDLSREEWNDAVSAQSTANEMMTEAEQLRIQAENSGNVKDRLEIQKAAFERETEAIEVYSRVNRALSKWEQGIPVEYSAAELDGDKVVRRARPLDEIIETELLAVESETLLSEESGATEPVSSSENKTSQTDPTADVLAQQLNQADDETFNTALREHFQLTPEKVERINDRPVYVDWFKKQWLADSLETLKASRFTQAENLLNEAEAKLLASEQATASAQAETDAAKQRDEYDRAAALQEEAKALFEEARRLREEMGRYSDAAENAREEADALLAGLEDDEAETLTQLAPPRSARIESKRDSERNLAESSGSIEEDLVSGNDVQDPVVTEEAVGQESEEIFDRGTENSEVDDAGAQIAQRNDQEGEPASTENQTSAETQISPNTNRSLPDVDFSAGITEVFETTNEPAYSASNPIPIGVEWPDGLVFAVQVGAFRNPIPQDHFRGFSPVRGEVIRDGITRYSAGLFTEFNRANEAKNLIRQKGYSDAFVVAYLNGERIPLNRALDENQAADIIAAQSGERRTQPQTETTQDPVTPSDISGRNEFDPAAAVTDYYDDPDAAPAVQVERVRGLFFTVQVGVYSNPVSTDDLFNITPLNSEQTTSGNIRYTSGMFPNPEFASDHRQIVVNAGVSDAFVTAYFNGKRVTMSEARQLLEDKGESVLASSPKAEDVNEGEDSTVDESPANRVIEQGTNSREVTTQSDEEVLEDSYADAADFAPEDIRFVVDLGSFGTGMPQQTADAILQISEAGVTRLELPDGKMHYLSRPTPNYAEAAALRDQFIEAGVSKVDLRAMALGFLLDVEDARRVSGQ